MVNDNFDARQLIVKFNDGSHFRALEGRLTNAVPEEIAPVQELLDSLPRAHWRRVDKISEEQMEALRQTAQIKLGRALPDLNQQFRVFLPANTNAAPVIDALNALDIVELAQPVPIPSLPVAGNYRPLQGYLDLPQDGIGAASALTNCNLGGETVKVCDIEYSYTPTHLDLPAVTLLGGDIILGGQMDPFAEAHGTASLGVMASLNDGIGTVGIAPNSSYYFYGIWEYEIIEDVPMPVWDIPGSITAVIPSLNAGDVILLELQIGGICGTSPVEWDLPTYNRIVLAIGQGITVIEPAANGSVSLDAPCFSTGNGGHWPFLPGNGSGAIMVGAGAAPPAFGGTDVARSRLPFSNYGSAVHVQGWGERVTTTGFGGLYNLGGLNELYTDNYGGTSSASPIVAGACALLQSVFKFKTGGQVLIPAQIRQVLVNTGTPQQAGVFPVSQQIGPLPNLQNALFQVVPPKLYLNTDPVKWIVTWDGCGYLESSPTLTPTPTWAPVEIGVINNTYSLDPAAVRAGGTRFFRLRWR